MGITNGSHNTKPIRIALIPGDGIGKEVIPASRAVLAALPLAFEFVELEAGYETFERTGSALPPETLAALRQCRGALFGATSSPSRHVPGYTSPILAMRKALDLYANLRPSISAPVDGSRPAIDRLPAIDMLIVRENTECLYVKRETLSDDGETATAQRVITRRASTRIAEIAFRMAQRRQPQRIAAGAPSRVTIVHKANVLNLTDGLFRASALDVAKAYPAIAVEEQLVDSMLYRMIREPQRYDVIVAPNLYGDLLSDAAAALTGGLGLAPSANVGDNFVLAEPVHGSAPDIAGKGIANPLAAIRAAGLMLQFLGLPECAAIVEAAVQRALEQRVWTPDLGGSATTEEVTTAVLGGVKTAASSLAPTASS